MKFKVTGANRQTGARVTMELDANNRATAERKAVQSGMEVLHIEQVIEGDSQAHGSKHRGEVEVPTGRFARLLMLVVFIAAVIAGVMFWERIRAWMQ